jgi:hypothetical protein
MCRGNMHIGATGGGPAAGPCLQVCCGGVHLPVGWRRLACVAQCGPATVLAGRRRLSAGSLHVGMTVVGYEDRRDSCRRHSGSGWVAHNTWWWLAASPGYASQRGACIHHTIHPHAVGYSCMEKECEDQGMPPAATTTGWQAPCGQQQQWCFGNWDPSAVPPAQHQPTWVVDWHVCSWLQRRPISAAHNGLRDPSGWRQHCCQQ